MIFLSNKKVYFYIITLAPTKIITMRNVFRFLVFIQMGCLSSLSVFAQFSWRADTPAYLDGTLAGHNYVSVGGTPSRDVAISAFTQGSAVAWQPNNPSVPTSTASRLNLGVNHTTNDPANAVVSFTMTFSTSVCGLTFPMYDIDRGGTANPYTYVDEVVLTATADGGGTLPTPTIAPSAFASVSGNVITGIASDGTNSPGGITTITYPANQCVKTLTITYRTGANAQPNPVNQLVSIGDMNWNTSLPVRLLSFKSEPLPTAVELSWQTGEEVGNSHFDIERSRDAIGFEAIGRVAGQGNSSERVPYTFLDASARVGLNYYRIKQVDFDGTFAYSRIIAAQFDGQGSFRAYPNPANHILNLEFPRATEVTSVQLIDWSGRVVRQLLPTPQVQLNDLQSGVYLLKAHTTDGQSFQQRVVKLD